MSRINEVRQVVEILDRENFPNLTRMRRVNPESLVQFLLDQADARPEDSIETMASSLESDLQHSAPTNSDAT